MNDHERYIYAMVSKLERHADRLDEKIGYTVREIDRLKAELDKDMQAATDVRKAVESMRKHYPTTGYGSGWETLKSEQELVL